VSTVSGVPLPDCQRWRPQCGDRALLVAEAVALVDDHFPGWLQVAFTDAAGQRWTVVDKVPVFTEAGISAQTLFPVPVMIGCTVIAVNSTALGDYPKVTVSTAVDAVAAQGDVDVFTVVADQLREARSC
jgi:hypothetical protein